MSDSIEKVRFHLDDSETAAETAGYRNKQGQQQLHLQLHWFRRELRGRRRFRVISVIRVKTPLVPGVNDFIAGGVVL